MSYSKIKKVRLSKYDRIWSKMAREKTPYCEVCKTTQNLAAHHFIRRSVKSTRLLLENAVVLCPSHHVFSHEFSAHRTPEAFKRWFKKTYPDRAKECERRAKTMMTERNAVIEFQSLLKELE